MTVALGHDYLTQRGGAERVALEFTRIFPDASLHTSVYAPRQTFSAFNEVDVRTTWLQHLAPMRRDPRLALPLLPSAWDAHPPVDADVVLTSSTGFAHGIRVEQGCRKIVYCHNPPRWLYQPEDYLGTGALRAGFQVLRPFLQRWDERAASTASLYIANSSAVASRIEAAYGIRAAVLHPPVSINTEGPQRRLPGLEPGYWLTIARSRAYKNVQAVADGISLLRGERLVIAGGGGEAIAGPQVTKVGVVDDAQLRWLYANAKALVSISYEDFGLTPIEANAFGAPVAVLRAGGFLDSTDEGTSGVFIESPTPAAVASALADFPAFDVAAVRAHAARFSPAEFQRSLRILMGGDETPDLPGAGTPSRGE